MPLVAGVQAVYNGSGLQYYRHADWLGSSRFATTATGAVRYDPIPRPILALTTLECQLTHPE